MLICRVRLAQSVMSHPATAVEYATLIALRCSLMLSVERRYANSMEPPIQGVGGFVAIGKLQEGVPTLLTSSN